MFKIGDEPVPGYCLEAFLGRGQFGEVWRATAPGGASVALKLINLTGHAGLKENFALQRIKQIRHPNLMPITALWTLDESGSVIRDSAQPAIEAASAGRTVAPTPLQKTMQPQCLVVGMLLGSQSLSARLEECRSKGGVGIPEPELLRFMEDAARGIDFLNSCQHDLGAGLEAIQHCDIKPDNMIVVGDAVVICDFGLARTLNERTATGMLGSPAYIAPECIRHKPSVATDQYSLAISYTQLRTGQLPFAVESYAAVLEAHRTGDLDLSKLDPAERAAVRKATSLQPGARFPSASAFIAALRGASSTPRRRSRKLAWLGAGLLSVSAAAGGTWWRSDHYRRPLRAEVAEAPQPKPDNTRDPPKAKSRELLPNRTAPHKAGGRVTTLSKSSYINRPKRRLGHQPADVVAPKNGGVSYDREHSPDLKDERRIPQPLSKSSGDSRNTISSPSSSPSEPFELENSPEVPAAELAVEPEFVNSIGMRLIRIEPGEFDMGSPLNRVDDPHGHFFADEQPRHRVRITRPFYLGAHEVTVGQFREFVSATKYKTDAEKDGGFGWDPISGRLDGPSRSYSWQAPGWDQSDQHPVVNVSWRDADRFSEWLGQKENCRYRLPSEAEWEYASRAGSTDRLWGISGVDELAQHANVPDIAARSIASRWPLANMSDGYAFSAPVGQFAANDFGLFDTSGNVWEWCSDWHGTEYYTESPRTDPQGPALGEYRVLRGGSWAGSIHTVRPAIRLKSHPRDCFYSYGFRVVRDIDQRPDQSSAAD